MLSPTSLAGLSVTPDYQPPICAVSQTPGASQGVPQQQMAPFNPLPLSLQGPSAVKPSASTPRGSLLDISV